MAPGGGVCKDVIESHPKTLKYDVATTKTDKIISRTAPGASGKHGIQSTNGVHELLECPVCTTLMYPPIHQVCFVPTYHLIGINDKSTIFLKFFKEKGYGKESVFVIFYTNMFHITKYHEISRAQSIATMT